MKARKAPKFIGNLLAFIIAETFAVLLAAAIGVVFLMLLMLLGLWIGIGNNLLIYFACVCIFYKAYDIVAWIAKKIDDKIDLTI